MQAFFGTNRRAYDAVLVILRLAAAIVMWPHGAQKMLGWFGGQGFAATVNGMSSHMGIPPFLVVIVVLVEFAGPILLVLGLLTRLVALGIIVDMLVAALTVHLVNGFFMNFYNNQKGEGIEYFIYAVGINLALLIAGAGRYSIDARIARES